MDDQQYIEDSKVLLSRMRIATYPLKRTLEKIKHNEKRMAMLKQAEILEEAMTALEKYLHR